MDSEELKGLPECHTVLVWPHYQFLGTLYIDLKDFGARPWEPHQHLEFMNALCVLSNRLSGDSAQAAEQGIVERGVSGYYIEGSARRGPP